MRLLRDVGFLGNDTSRSRAYIDAMARAGLRPACALLIASPVEVAAASQPTSTPLFDNRTPLEQCLAALQVPFEVIEAESVNDDAVVAAVAAMPSDVLVFSGAPGGLLRPPLFATGKRFLHVHPGRLPDYRGSTPMYYSLLEQDALCASALFLNEEIDAGEVLAERDFEPPADRTTIDRDFDPWMRAQLMAEVLEDYARSGQWQARPQPTDGGRTLYIIHPVLKHLAILQGEPSL